MKKISCIFVMLLVSACTSISNKTSAPKTHNYLIKNDLATISDRLVGEYVVKGSRINHKKVTFIRVTNPSGTLNIDLYQSGAECEQPVESILAAKCEGGVNETLNIVSVICTKKDIYARSNPYFWLKNIEKTFVVKSGALFSVFEPLSVEPGYYLRFNAGESRTDSHYALQKK